VSIRDLNPTRRDVLAAGLAGTTALVLPQPSWGAGSLRVGSLKFGSLGWLLETVISEGLDTSHGFKLDLVDMASTGAAKIALLSGDADVIVSDWPWAMRQRSEGEAVQFAPYSSALGAVMVNSDSPIKTVADLEGKRLGIAGTALDKSWLLLRAYARKQTGRDLADTVSPVFGAAPLITEQIRQDRVDAALNFWTFSARLQGAGYRELISMADVLSGLGISPVPSLVGFIWDEKKTAGKKQEIGKFLLAINAANGVLATSEDAWARLKPRMRVKSDAEFEALKAYYRSGIPVGWSSAQSASAEKLFGLLVELGEKTLVGSNTKFDPALFHGA
jgi:NitT/TauT family transport system substrate-binding protein